MSVKILQGNCINKMAEIEQGSVNCCVTSPPYFGLRDYGTAKWDGGDPSCDHKIPVGEHDKKRGDGRDESSSHTIRFNRTQCHKCGAVRIDEQIGLEETPEDYVQKLVRVFREVKRVLRDDGTLWLNLGDSYARQGGKESNQPRHWDGRKLDPGAMHSTRHVDNLGGGLKPKDLIGIPWRVAFALQADGWYLRQDIIWHKPNPMPESVTDRCTKAHEYIFLLSKSARYYFDAGAISEPATNAGVRVSLGPKSFSKGQAAGMCIKATGNGCADVYDVAETRNRRSVWTVTTKPYKGAHFATFPPDLIRPCILAGCPEGGTVLDPFGGSGTTAEVAESEGRNSILIELNPEYVKLAEERTSQIGLFC